METRNPSFSSFAQDLLMSSRPVLVFLTFATISLVIATSDLSVYRSGTPILPVRLSLYVILVLGWLLYAYHETASKVFLVTGITLLLFAVSILWGISDAVALYFVPVALAGAMLGFWAGFTAAGVVSLMVFFGVRAGGLTATGLQITLALFSVWGTAGLIAMIYRPILEIGDWIWRFHLQAVQIFQDATNYRLELNQAMEDLTHMNRQLALANEKQLAFRIMAEEAQKTKAAFVAKVSHEFRTPLNMIIGLVNLMIDSPEIYGRILPKAMVNDLEIIQRNCDHLTGMINDVLALSQAESGRLTLNREYVDLSAVILQAMEVVNPLVKKKGLETRYAAPEQLSLAYCDRTRIRQVLLNLISNAARFTESGGIYVEVEDQPSALLVSVRDTGPGIAVEDAERIFDPFCQGGTNQPLRDKGGTGLGLTISKQFIELHGGKIWLESRLGEGATFYFTLPKELPIGPTVSAGRWISENWKWISRQGKPHYSMGESQKMRLAVLDPNQRIPDFLLSYQDRIEYAVAGDVPHLIEELTQSPANMVMVNASSLKDLEDSIESIRLEIKDTPVVGCVFRKPILPVSGGNVFRQLVKPITKRDLICAVNDLQRPVKKVLLIDNDVDIIDLYTRMLKAEEAGLEVYTATSGEDGLAVMGACLPDLVVLDLTMPGMDGFAVLAEKNMNALIRDIPVMIVSAMDIRENVGQTPFFVATMGEGLGPSQTLECAVGITQILLKTDLRPGQELG